MGAEFGLQAGWQHGDPVFLPLAVADDDLIAVEVEVLDSQSQAFQQPHACPVEQPGNEPVSAVEPGQQAADFVAGENGGEALWPLGASKLADGAEVLVEDLMIEEDEGIEGLVLGTGRDAAPHGKVFQE